VVVDGDCCCDPMSWFECLIAANDMELGIGRSIGKISAPLSLFPQEKKEIHVATQFRAIRYLTDFHRHVRSGSFPPVSPAKFQPPGMPAGYLPLLLLAAIC